MNKIESSISRGLPTTQVPGQMRRVYKREYDRLVALKEQSNAYNGLAKKFPNDDTEARDFLKKAYSKSNKGRSSTVMNNFGIFEFCEHMPPVLNTEELEKLKERKPQLYERILKVYLAFLQEREGL